MSLETVQERSANFTPGGSEHQSPKQVQEERREAIERDREAREKPRKDFMRSGKGKASDFFDTNSNRDYVERVSDQAGAPRDVETLSDKPQKGEKLSAREKWLRTGELEPASTPKKTEASEAKPAAEKPTRPKMADFTSDGKLDAEGYERALDAYEQARQVWQAEEAKRAEANPSSQVEVDPDASHFEGEGAKRWTKEAHETRMKSTASILQELHKRGETDKSTALNRISIPKDAAPFFLHTLADCRNPEGVLQYIADHGIADNWKWRTKQDVKDVIADFSWIDKKVGGRKNGNGNGDTPRESKSERKLTQAGRPPSEPSGGSSSPEDDGSSEAAFRRKDLTIEQRGELYRERKNAEEIKKRRARYGRRR